ncbi:ABC transporter ATP-binding protein [Sporomusa termitida]|uniref:Oligopeptide transport ATP-binding protein OppF n=1 Tax=Sporomusa termitida TaxID=2377 RepID=A0A517DV32_9FIRM|nr:oligopeptide/dipeptide ABC transporter ATP-binding protein [Sporomusa termitida]QDR81211.1 Oligopeptide transport ATP-binding protein OppF [Sporomusa termitida]
MDTILLKTVNLKKHFKVSEGTLHAVDGINLQIAKGHTLGIVGESGCGKSTLGRTVLQLVKPTAGEIWFNGQQISHCSHQEWVALRKDMQIIFQDPFSSLNPRMSVYELIAEPLISNHIYKNNADLSQRIFALMVTVGLAERFVNMYPHEMDGGRRQRIGIARALALNPQFIVCDEPVSALDVSIQAQILNLLMDLQEDLGLTYMFITHDLSVVKHISTEVAVLYLGQCVERAPVRELFKHPLHPYTQALLAAIPVPSLSVKRDRAIIKGEVSNPVNPQPGCRFAARCPQVSAACTGRDTELKDQGNDHYVACFLYR